MRFGEHGHYELRVELPATLDAVEEFISRTRTIWEQCETRQDDFATELLLREALTNAVVHGSRSDPARRVRCMLRLKPCRLFFTVRDDGAGFDWRSAWNRQSVAADCSGRGMEILRKYATRVRFNGPGNQVAIAKHLG